MIQLSKTQMKHLESLRWLLSNNQGNWGTGRSYLMAFCFFMEALETGKEIEVFDHCIGAYRSKNILFQIMQIAKEMQAGEIAANLQINHARQTIKVLNWQEFIPKK